MNCHSIIEKPTEEQIMSHYSILGRLILPPEIFSILEEGIKHSGDAEFYLTDSMSDLAKAGKLLAYDFDGTRYDMGNKLGMMKANCEVALNHPEIGESFRAYLKELSSKL